MISVKILLIFSAFFLMSSCFLFRGNTNKFAVKVNFSGDAAMQKLEDVRVIIGSDNFWWSDFKMGEEKSVNLYAAKNAVNNVTLLYKIGGKAMSWESENLAENADYQINLTIDKDGNVTKNLVKLK
ncbi:MAG TPA: hypothetical protein PKE69_24880 [Pyrinomonadaceae bacterium]|mgnify:CR=1 FL=1|nr:hypothetical protein [Pyrinomonadaceae bacterium]